MKPPKQSYGMKPRAMAFLIIKLKQHDPAAQGSLSKQQIDFAEYCPAYLCMRCLQVTRVTRSPTGPHSPHSDALECGMLHNSPAHKLPADHARDAALLQDLTADIQGQIAAVNHTLHKVEVPAGIMCVRGGLA